MRTAFVLVICWIIITIIITNHHYCALQPVRHLLLSTSTTITWPALNGAATASGRPISNLTLFSIQSNPSTQDLMRLDSCDAHHNNNQRSRPLSGKSNKSKLFSAPRSISDVERQSAGQLRWMSVVVVCTKDRPIVMLIRIISTWHLPFLPGSRSDRRVLPWMVAKQRLLSRL